VQGFAVWRLKVDAYAPGAPDGAKGGVMYPCLRSPPMLETDERGNCWVAQDCVDQLLRIDHATGEAAQLACPFEGRDQLRLIGPAIGRAPDGSIWLTQLGGYAALVRVDPTSHARVLYEVGGPPWARALRLIHLAFSAKSSGDPLNRIYALASDLLDDEAVNALVVLSVDDSWQTVLGRRVMPLPTQDCACHRIAFVEDVDRPECRSVVISEMASSKVVQIMVANLLELVPLEETVVTAAQSADGFERRTYTSLEKEEGMRA